MPKDPMPALPIQLSVLVLVAVNLLPLGGVLFYGLTVFAVMVLFWAENVVIGILNVAKMLTLYKLRGDPLALGVAIFFAMHYGIFTGVHGMFVFTLFGPDEYGSGDLSTVDAGFGVFAIPLLALIASHTLSFLFNFLWQKEYMVVTANELMIRPYSRVIALHMTILCGGFLVMLLGAPVFALVLLILIKIGIDVAAHVHEHRSLQARIVAEPAPGTA
jgi:hypothetical protein